MALEAIGGYNGFLESHQKAPGEASVMASKGYRPWIKRYQTMPPTRHELVSFR
jgi:hypothetical protein